MDAARNRTASRQGDFRKAIISLRNIDTERPGQIIVFIFLKSGFPKDHAQAIRSYTYAPAAAEMAIVVEVPSSAEFAVKVLHDEDMDSRVSKNWTGYIPKEGLGFSAGATILTGAPSFRRAKINSAASQTIEISMRYPGRFGI